MEEQGRRGVVGGLRARGGVGGIGSRVWGLGGLWAEKGYAIGGGASFGLSW